MNKKKTIITITIYLACLLVVIGAFLFYWKYENEKDKSFAYVAKIEVKDGTKMNRTTFGTFFEKKEIPSYVIKDLANLGGMPVQDGGKIMEKEALVDIKAGTIILETMFGIADEGIKQDGFERPVLIQMPATQKSMPAGGFKLEQNITIFGKMPLSAIQGGGSGYDDVLGQNWLGILTNKAVVKNIYKDENGVTNGVSIVVEETAVPSLIVASTDAILYYFEGSLTNIDGQVQSDILKGIYDSTGLNDKRDFALSIEAKDENGNVVAFWVVDATEEGKEFEELPIFKLPKTEKKGSINFRWIGKATNAFVTNYKFDGHYGQGHGNYSYVSQDVNRKIVFDQVNENKTFRANFDAEGYYEISFKDEGRQPINKYRFVLEESEYAWKEEGEIRILTENTVSDKHIFKSFENTYALTKDYFKNVPALKDYKERLKLNKELTDLNVGGSPYVYDNKEGIGKLRGSEITGIDFALTSDERVRTVNLFWGIDKQKIDFAVDENLTNYFQTKEEIIIGNKTFSGIELFKGQEQFLKDNYKYSELVNLIEQVDEKHGGIVDLSGSFRDSLKALLKYSIIPHTGLTNAEIISLAHFLYGDNYELGTSPKENTGSLNIIIKINEERHSIPVTVIFGEKNKG